MKFTKKMKKKMSFDLELEKELKDPVFKKAFDEAGKQLEIAYKINKLRIEAGMTQAEFARKLGTSQSNIARIVIGNQNCTTATLQKIAEVFNKELRVEFV